MLQFLSHVTVPSGYSSFRLQFLPHLRVPSPRYSSFSKLQLLHVTGSGKSTMLKYFDSYSDVELIPEPVSEWCNVNGHNLLGNKLRGSVSSVAGPGNKGAGSITALEIQTV